LAAFEFGSFALTAAGEAIFLELQIAEFFFMLTADVEFDSGFRFSGGVAGRFIEKCSYASGEDGQFHTGDLA
jgi:hypothetical protein